MDELLAEVACSPWEEASDSTVYSYGMSMLAFLHWLEREEVIEKPITSRFRLPHVEQKFIPTYTPGDIEKMLDACEEGDQAKPRLRKALTARNRAIVTVLVDAGLRRSEIVGLRLCDVDRELRLLVVHRKGNKWQQVPVSRDGFRPLHEYLISAHNCRRYMATTQLAAGRSPLDVQRQMGHTTLKMTNHFYSQTVEQLQRTQEMYSPLRVRKSEGETGGDGSGYWDE